MFLDKKLEEEITLLVESLGAAVYDIECTGSKIVVYIDKEDGVSVNDCENVSRSISVLLDVNDPFEHSYILEVSSPGINRKLKKREHFEKAVGKKCVIKTHSAIESSKVFRGILKMCDETGIVMYNKDKEINIEFDNIKNARLDEDIGGKK